MSEAGGSGSELSAGELVSRLSEQISQLVRDELRLALTELKQKIKRAGRGGGLIAAAGVVALFGLGALMVAVIAALSRVLPVWAAALIVGGAALLLSGLLTLTGIDQVKGGTPPMPEQAIARIKRGIQTVTESAKR
ncbi:MAG: hypothetical protein DLM62_05620 [Pseudonocardiales bacterium]|nr:MAG: hypothetical protein DLM62_05620 [Pseudonocardiales bacterium]